MKSLKDFNYLLSLDRRYTKTESEIFRIVHILNVFVMRQPFLITQKTKCHVLLLLFHHWKNKRK